jgi:hypothetical protein
MSNFRKRHNKKKKQSTGGTWHTNSAYAFLGAENKESFKQRRQTFIQTKGVTMDLKEYFENNRGTGIISTADSEGNVDCAVYARPHVMEDGTIAMIMRDRLSHRNLESNPKAAYMFIEKGPGYKGKRLFLTKIREEKDSELIASLQRRTYSEDDAATGEGKFLVYFTVDKELPLIGSGEN